MTISQRSVLSMRHFSDKFAEKIKTHIFCSITFLRQLFHLWDNVEIYGTTGQATSYNIIQHMNIACWITKATDTRSWCVILPAFPLQQWLHERASILHYTYNAWVVTNTVGTQNYCAHWETYLHMYCLLVIWRKSSAQTLNYCVTERSKVSGGIYLMFVRSRVARKSTLESSRVVWLFEAWNSSQ